MKKIISIPATRLAADDETLKAKREELKKKLLEGKKVLLHLTAMSLKVMKLPRL